MSSRASYYRKDERYNSETVLLSHDYSVPVISLVKSVETKLMGQGTVNEILTVGNWSFPLEAIHETHRRIAELGADNETYKYTTEWLQQLRKIVVANQMWWGEPLINLSIDSEIVFEWWHGTKKLTVYILRNTAEYIKVWGTDIDNEMEDGTSSSPTELTALWKWLVS
jgi:hypothetical protein